jgi:hypothetical protein
VRDDEEQLALDVDEEEPDDGRSWDEWFRSLPAVV